MLKHELARFMVPIFFVTTAALEGILKRRLLQNILTSSLWSGKNSVQSNEYPHKCNRGAR